jgi:anti-anti-sigma factor
MAQSVTQPMTQVMNRITPMTVTVHQHGEATVVEVRGEVDLLTAPRLRETVVAMLDHEPPVVVIDLLEVGFVGTAGFAALIEAQHRTGDRTRLRIAAPARMTRQLQLIGVDRRLACYPTRDEALAPPSLRLGACRLSRDE